MVTYSTENDNDSTRLINSDYFSNLSLLMEAMLASCVVTRSTGFKCRVTVITESLIDSKVVRYRNLLLLLPWK